MKTDIYTKTVLTVIAVCLFVSTFTPYDFMNKAHANEIDKISEILSAPTEVKIVGVSSSVVMGISLEEVLGVPVASFHYGNDADGVSRSAPVVFAIPSK